MIGKNIALGRRDAQLLRPHLHYADEHRHHRRVAEKRAKARDGQHQPCHRPSVALGLAQQVAHDPLQDASVHQARHDNEQDSDDHHGRGAEAGARLLGVKNARHEQHAHGREEHRVGPQLRQQKRGEHSEHRDDCYPGMQSKPK